MYQHDNTEPIMVSAIEHFSYCPRQCALIHLEQTFDENLYTLRGRAVHEVVHEESSGVHEAAVCERSLPIWSERLGLVGKADLVEFKEGMPYPVEYKSGRTRTGEHEMLQLGAQALCLEEMFRVSVDKGAIFWHASRKRKEVVITPELRSKVEEISMHVHKMLKGESIPAPVNDARCKLCSLRDSCLPKVTGFETGIKRAAAALFTVKPS